MPVKLSIGVAVYNVRENFLRECIKNIKKQLTDETELLLINDCSTDNSGDICKEYAEEDSRIRYINMEKNGGLSVVRNRTISEAEGEWIFFADGDDILSDHFIETALSFCDTDYDIIIHDREIFSGEKGTEKACSVTKLTPLPKEAGREISLSCLCLKPFCPEKYGMTSDAYYHAAWGALYRREFLIGNDLKFPVGQKKAQDSVFNTYAYFCAEKIAYLPYKMYYYRKDMQGITQRYSADFTKMIMSLLQHHFKCIESLYNNDDEIKKIYKNNRVMTFVLDAMRLNFFHKDNKNPRKIRKAEFISFINTEPFKSAVDEFDLNGCDWWGWRLPIKYAKKKNFDALEFAFKYDKLFRIYGGLNSRFGKVFRIIAGNRQKRKNFLS